MIVPILLFSFPSHAQRQGEDLRQLLQLVEYLGVDYPEAVADGKVINQDEYKEMEEFASLILQKIEQSSLLKKSAPLQEQARMLSEAVSKKYDPSKISKITNKIRKLILEDAPIQAVPEQLLAYKQVAPIYQHRCSSCHGLQGNGDGQLAKTLSPQPTNFTLKERAIQRSILGLYQAIGSGIEGTAMTSYSDLDEKTRWSLAFYVGHLSLKQPNNGQQQKPGKSNLTLQDLVLYSPQSLLNEHSDLSIDKILMLRSKPEQFLKNQEETPFQTTKQLLSQSKETYLNQNKKQALTLAISAYLDGFELIENSLDAYDQELRKSIESKMMTLRHQIKNEQSEKIVIATFEAIEKEMSKAEQLLTASTLSNTTLFTSSFAILLREGLEALLVILTLSTILIRSKRSDVLKYVHFGWISALIGGAFTWLIARKLIEISGASREIMEGVAGLTAAIILFYVGFWLHNKSQAQQWQQFIKQAIQVRLNQGTLWGIAGLSFIAVYREVFETILFYEALLAQTNQNQFFALGWGILSGFITLALIAWLIIKYSIKLPIGLFFKVTTYLLLALSFILTGKAISAMQEANLFYITPLPVHFEFHWLGVYATWQGIIAQLFILLSACYLFFKQSKKESEQSLTPKS